MSGGFRARAIPGVTPERPCPRRASERQGRAAAREQGSAAWGLLGGLRPLPRGRARSAAARAVRAGARRRGAEVRARARVHIPYPNPDLEGAAGAQATWRASAAPTCTAT